MFTIFTIAYIIIFAFIGATFKFIKIIITVPAKGLSGMWGLFYNNNKSIKKGEKSKQLVKPQSSPKLGDVILTLTLVILKIDNF